MDNREYVTENTFVNGNYLENAQTTECEVLRGFFLEDDFWKTDMLTDVIEAMKNYNGKN